jgi:hypothetical protein
MRAHFGARAEPGLPPSPRLRTSGGRSLGSIPKAAWRGFRDHSQFLTVLAYFAIVLGAFYLPVGSKLMLAGFAATVALLLIAMLARLANGWRLIVIAFCHALLCIGVVRGLAVIDVSGLSELMVYQVTIPIALIYASMIDRDERDLDRLEHR